MLFQREQFEALVILKLYFRMFEYYDIQIFGNKCAIPLRLLSFPRFHSPPNGHFGASICLTDAYQ